MKTSVHRLTQFGEALRFVREYTAPQIDRPFAEALANELRTNGTPVDEASFKAMVERLKTATGLKGKTLFMPLRLAITGPDHGPGARARDPATAARERSRPDRALAAGARRAMYRLIRSLLFHLDAESAHEWTADQMVALQQIPIALQRDRTILTAAGERGAAVVRSELSCRRSASPPASTRTR